MRLRLSMALALLLVAATATAQQSNRITVFASDVGRISSDYFGAHWTGGGGVALNHFWSPRFSTELAAAAERDYRGFVLFNFDGSVRERSQTGYTTYPIDLLAQYHFQNDTRWKPYLGFGAHYSPRPRIFPRELSANVAPQLNGGVVFNLNSRFGIALDGRLVPHRDAADWDPMFRTSAGLTWRW